MNSNITYKFLSKVYDLLDIFYFHKKETSPRTAILQYIPDEKLRILDICTGTGTSMIEMGKERKKAKFTGIDRSKEMLSLARRKIKKSGLNNVKVKLCDATNMGFKDNLFDVVTISLVLHESDENLVKEILKESKRVLKEEGKLLVTEWEHPKNLIKKFLFFPIKKFEPGVFEGFLKLDMKEYFHQFGFEVIGIKYCDYTKIIECGKEKTDAS